MRLSFILGESLLSEVGNLPDPYTADPKKRQEQTATINRIGSFIYKMVKTAADRSNKNNNNGNKGDFLSVVKQVWKPNDGKTRFAIPPELQPTDAMPYLVELAMDGDTYASYGKQFGIIHIDVSSIQGAKSPRDVMDALRDVLGKTHHELSHIYYSGNTPNYSKQDELSKKVFQYIKYMATAGEVQSFAKQFAILYHRAYPGQPYNWMKMAKLALQWRKQNPDSLNASVGMDYFINIRAPEQHYSKVLDKYSFEVLTKSNIFQTIANAIDHFMSYFVGHYLSPAA